MIEVAAFFGQPDFMGLARMLTHRQFTTLSFWVKDQINQPSRADHYLMKLTAHIRSYLEQKPVSVEDCKLTWNFSYQTDNLKHSEEYLKQQAREAEDRTIAMLGIDPVDWYGPDGI